MKFCKVKQLLTLFISELNLCFYTFVAFLFRNNNRGSDKKPSKAGTKKRKMSTNDAFAKIDEALEAFVSYQQAADRKFLEAEEARERKEEERGGKEKEDQEFLLKLAQVLQK